MSGSGLDLTIVGGGPAGLTAGIYAVRARMKTVLIEKGLCGGQIVVTEKIENYPGFPAGISGPELAAHMEEQAKNLGLEIRAFAEVSSLLLEGNLKKVAAGGEEFLSRAVIIASGAQPKKLGIPGEDEFLGRGVSYCATCDGAFFKDKKVLVIGGGDSAAEEALFLAKFAAQVTIIHRRDELRAAKILQERAFANPKIDFLWDSHLIEIKGKDKVEAGVIQNKNTLEKTEIPADGVFMYVGILPNTEFAKGVIELDETGFVVTDSDLQSSAPGIFAAGDVRRNQLKQVSMAVGEGALAAMMAEKYLEEQKQ